MGFEGLGARLRAARATPAAAALDGALGALLTACVGLGVVWVLGAVALGSGGELRQEVQRSAILQRLNTVLPPTSGLLNALENLDPFPRIDGPEANVAAPSRGDRRRPAVDAAASSVVKVLGTACGLGVEGSGWVAGDGIVVTNAHVVAGQKDTRCCCRARSPGIDARRCTSTRATTSPCCACRACARRRSRSPPRRGHLGRGARIPPQRPYDERAGRLGGTREVVTQDAYGRGPVRRSITSLRGAVRSGNSGGADGRRARPRDDDDLRRDDLAGRAAATACPTRSCARRWRHRRLGVDGALRAEARRTAGGPATLAADEQDPRTRREALRRT